MYALDFKHDLQSITEQRWHEIIFPIYTTVPKYNKEDMLCESHNIM